MCTKLAKNKDKNGRNKIEGKREKIKRCKKASHCDEIKNDLHIPLRQKQNFITKNQITATRSGRFDTILRLYILPYT